MSDHDPIDRETCAAYLRQLADQVERGDIEGIWVVATERRGLPMEQGRFGLYGPSPDDIALARLYLRMSQGRDLLMNALNGDLGVEITNRKTGPREEGK